MKLKQKKITRMYKFSLTCMEGDADGFKTGSIFIPQYTGSYLEQVTPILVDQIRKARRGLSGRASQKLCTDTRELLGALQYFQDQAAQNGSPGIQISEEDCAADFMYELCYGHYGPGDDIRDPHELELTYFDDQGDEYLVFKADDKGKTDY